MNPTPFVRGLVAVAVGIALAGCSTAPAAPSPGSAKVAPSLTALFQQTLDQRGPSLSSFEREVIERAVREGRLSAADYQEAVNRRTQCMTDAGYTESAVQQPNGLIKISPQMPTSGDVNQWMERYIDKSDACADGTLKVIEMLYLDQQGNPDLLADPLDIIITCLRKEGVVDDAFTTDDLRAWSENPKGTTLPFSLTDPKATQCLANGGIAVQSQAEQVG